MKTEKQKWVEDALSFSDRAIPVNTDVHIWEGILSRITVTPKQIFLVPARTVWLAAASIALLAALNVAIMSTRSGLDQHPWPNLPSSYSLTGSFNLY